MTQTPFPFYADAHQEMEKRGHCALLDMALTHASVSGCRLQSVLSDLGAAFLQLALIEHCVRTNWQQAPDACSRATMCLGADRDWWATFYQGCLGPHLIYNTSALGTSLSASVQREVTYAAFGAAALSNLPFAQVMAHRSVIHRLRHPPNTQTTTAKSELQHLAQLRTGCAPSYEVIATRGPEHAREFDVRCSLAKSATAIGTGRTIKDAEKDAASRVLAILLPSAQRKHFTSAHDTDPPYARDGRVPPPFSLACWLERSTPHPDLQRIHLPGSSLLADLSATALDPVLLGSSLTHPTYFGTVEHSRHHCTLVRSGLATLGNAALSVCAYLDALAPLREDVQSYASQAASLELQARAAGRLDWILAIRHCVAEPLRPFIRVGPGFRGVIPESLLVEALESVVGAVYLQQMNLDALSAWLRSERATAAMTAPVPMSADEVGAVRSFPAKSRLQALYQAVYRREFSETGSVSAARQTGPQHKSTFTCYLSDDPDQKLVGRGARIRDAEEDLAAQLLQLLDGYLVEELEARTPLPCRSPWLLALAEDLRTLAADGSGHFAYEVSTLVGPRVSLLHRSLFELADALDSHESLERRLRTVHSAHALTPWRVVANVLRGHLIDRIDRGVALLVSATRTRLNDVSSTPSSKLASHIPRLSRTVTTELMCLRALDLNTWCTCDVSSELIALRDTYPSTLPALLPTGIAVLDAVALRTVLELLMHLVPAEAVLRCDVTESTDGLEYVIDGLVETGECLSEVQAVAQFAGVMSVGFCLRVSETEWSIRIPLRSSVLTEHPSEAFADTLWRRGEYGDAWMITMSIGHSVKSALGASYATALHDLKNLLSVAVNNPGSFSVETCVAFIALFGRSAQALARPQPRRISTQEVAAALRSALTPFVQDTQVTTTLDISAEPAFVYADEQALACLCSNLTSNAVAAARTSHERRASILILLDADELLVTVQNSVADIRAAEARILREEGIYTGSASRGLGLMIIRRMIRVLMGRIKYSFRGSDVLAEASVRVSAEAAIALLDGEPGGGAARTV